jgi:hypothetical protein
MPSEDLEKTLQEAARKAGEDQLWATRGRAVQAYARLEQALCRIFANVSVTSPQIAAIIFFRIASASARNDILEKLIRLRHGRKYNLFWNSVLKALRPIDIDRNNIVHWVVIDQLIITESGLYKVELTLRPPTYWSTLANTPAKFNNTDLIKFIDKCDFYMNVMHGFAGAVENDSFINIPPDQLSTWLDIFQRPLIYPPQADILRSPTPTGPDIRPQSFPL